MDFIYPYNKKLYLTIEISRILHKYHCTYNEADKILQLITSEINQQRENLEYDAIDDYLNGHKTRCVDNDVIHPLPYF